MTWLTFAEGVFCIVFMLAAILVVAVGFSALGPARRRREAGGVAEARERAAEKRARHERAR